MNRWTVGGIFFATGMGVLAGVSFVWGEATANAEIKARNKYDEMLGSHLRALDLARNSYLEKAHDPVLTEDDLDVADTEDPIMVGGEMVAESAIAPDYLAVANHYTEQNVFVRPEEDMGMSYIEEEEYEEDDGRPKEQITILMGGIEDEPLYFMDGHQVDNWAELIGDQILVDFYRMVPPGQDRVLYVRNHKLDVDFEVIQETP